MYNHVISGVYFSLNGDIIPNHGYVMISDIGFTDDTALLCHTDRPPHNGSPHSGGNWFAPDGTRVNINSVPGLRRSRGPMVVRLRRFTDGDPPEGIYECRIAAESDSDNQVTSVHMGLYNSGGGVYNI